METFIIIIAILLGIFGIIGSFLPALPGPPLSWVGLFLLYLWGNGANSNGDAMSTKFLLIWLAITIIVTIIDYIVPAWFTKKFGGSKYASGGAIAGLILGVFFTPLGMILGSMLGAFLAELLFAQKNAGESFKSAIGALLGFIFGTGIKLIVSGIMLYYIFVFSW